ncbi:MFS transporter [Saccharospirillum mangrovi]|uniref:MFS transporter n=1 Tax=Saccharospirillum mangrovi TaxID=2161747 RepID=UPI000D332B68|nr:MFS transporter [Saccharospirillum mangrovi]
MSSPSISKSRRTAFSEPVFRPYFLAACFATLGTWIVRFMIGWFAWHLTESAFWVGAVSALLLVPTFALSPLFGVLSDRLDTRNGIIITATCNTLIAVTLTALYLLGRLSIEPLLLFALAFGSVTAAHQPMRLALMPRILPRELLPSGIGYSAIVFNTSRIIGPALAAALLTVSGPFWVFALATALFVTTAILLRRLPNAPAAERDQPASVLNDMGAGFRFIAQTPMIRLILAMTLVNGLLGRSVTELLPAISGHLAGGTPSALATLTASAGAGSILGGWVTSRQSGNPGRISWLVYLALCVSALVLMPVILLHGLVAMVPVIFVSSLFMTVIGTGSQALLQLTVDNAYRGRVLSIWSMVSLGAPSIGAFSMGAVAESFGFGWTLLIFSLVALGLTALLWQRRHRFYTLDGATHSTS